MPDKVKMATEHSDGEENAIGNVTRLSGELTDFAWKTVCASGFI